MHFPIFLIWGHFCDSVVHMSLWNSDIFTYGKYMFRSIEVKDRYVKVFRLSYLKFSAIVMVVGEFWKLNPHICSLTKLQNNAKVLI